MQARKHILNAEAEMNKACAVYNPSVYSMMQELVEALESIDHHHDAELSRLENSVTEEELKKYIRGKLLTYHREKREPYIELLTQLRKQTVASLS